MDNDEQNEEASFKFSRYVCEVVFKGDSYYTIWGADNTTFHKHAKVLVDDEGHFLLFKEIEDAIAYAKQWKGIFDKENFEHWFEAIKLPIEADYVIDFDLLNLDTFDVHNTELFDGLITSQNFADDYYTQINNEFWVAASSEYPMMDFFDAFMDRYVWSGVEEPKALTDTLITDVTVKFKELYTFLASKIKIM